MKRTIKSITAFAVTLTFIMSLIPAAFAIGSSNDYYETIDITQCVSRDDGNLGLYDTDGTQLCVFPTGYVMGFVGGIHQEGGGIFSTWGISIDKSSCFNLNTKQQMRLQLNEKIPTATEGATEENN